MHRCGVLLSAVVILLLGVLPLQAHPAAVAQEAISLADVSEEFFDLAWLAPVPADLDEDGYALALGAYHPVAEGGVSVFGLPGPLTSYDNAFSTADARQINFQAMSIPDEDDPDIVAQLLSVVIGEFADVDGAKAGFTEIVDLHRETHDQNRTPPEVGDEALAFRGEFSDELDGRIYKELRIVFRTDRFIVDVFIDDYLGDAPATTELMPVAEILADRLEKGEASESPSLALQVVRITGPDLNSFSDFYTRRGGEQIRLRGQLTTGVLADDESYEDIGVTDVYYYLSNALPTEENETQFNLNIELLLFTDRRMAQNFLESAAKNFLENWGASYHDAEIVSDVEELGDDSAAISVALKTTSGKLAEGYRVWVRAGDRAAAVEVTGFPEIPLSVAQKIAEAQLACFDDGTCVEPIAMSELH